MSYPATIRHKMRARYPVGKGDPFGGWGSTLRYPYCQTWKVNYSSFKKESAQNPSSRDTWKPSADMDVQPTWMYLS